MHRPFDCPSPDTRRAPCNLFPILRRGALWQLELLRRAEQVCRLRISVPPQTACFIKAPAYIVCLPLFHGAHACGRVGKGGMGTGLPRPVETLAAAGRRPPPHSAHRGGGSAQTAANLQGGWRVEGSTRGERWWSGRAVRPAWPLCKPVEAFTLRHIIPWLYLQPQPHSCTTPAVSAAAPAPHP